MAAKKIGNINYEEISVEELSEEVLVRAKAIFQQAINRFKAKGRQDIIDKIQQARKLAQIKRLQEKINNGYKQ